MAAGWCQLTVQPDAFQTAHVCHARSRLHSRHYSALRVMSLNAMCIYKSGIRQGFFVFFREVFGSSYEWMGVKGTEGGKKKVPIHHSGYSLRVEWYLLSSVPNQVLNRPSSLLNDACNRTRLQHRADKKHIQPEGHLDISLCRNFTLDICEVLSPSKTTITIEVGGSVPCEPQICSASDGTCKGSRGTCSETLRPVS